MDPRIVFSLMFFILASENDATLNGGRIIGGKDVEIENYPYQLSLQYKEEHNCGASIISKNFAITAAHCVHRINYTVLTIRAGSSIRENGGTVIALKNVYKNQNYLPDTYDSDIAILELFSPLIFDKNIQPIILPDKDEIVSSGTEVTVTGWGDTTENGDVSDHLKAAAVPIISQEECRTYYKPDEITDRMICAGYISGGTDACQGDSGGPLAVDGKLIGIVSWGEGCARPNYPSVYTYVSKVRGFITEITGI